MSRELKQMMSAEYTTAIKDRDALLFIDYRMNNADTKAFREALRQHGVRMLVVKNRVFDKALQDYGVSGFRDIAKGQVAVLYHQEKTEGGGQVASKAVHAWQKEKEDQATILGGIMDGAVASPAEAKKWKDLPTREEQLSMLMGQILGPGMTLSAALLGPGATLGSQVESKGNES